MNGVKAGGHDESRDPMHVTKREKRKRDSERQESCESNQKRCNTERTLQCKVPDLYAREVVDK